jgi:carboxymethylenebutenolidase
MCFTFDAIPPDLPPGFATQAAGSGEDLVLKSADGTQFLAYRARPQQPTGAAIVILPDVRGLFRFYSELANRFASAGIEAVAIDYFGRTAGLGARDESFDYMPHVSQTKITQISDDVQAAIDLLRSADTAPRAIFTVGFCFGGAASFLQASYGHGLSGVIGFYGIPVGTLRWGKPAPIDRVNDFECPVLGLFGGADQAIPESSVRQFDEALKKASVEHEFVTYPGAPHSFFDRKQNEFSKESADSWQRVLSFISAHTPSGQA